MKSIVKTSFLYCKLSYKIREYFKENKWIKWFVYSYDLSPTALYQYRIRMSYDIIARFYASIMIGSLATIYVIKVGDNDFYFGDKNHTYYKCIIFCLISLLIDIIIFAMIVLYQGIINHINLFGPFTISFKFKNGKLVHLWIIIFVWFSLQYI